MTGALDGGIANGALFEFIEIVAKFDVWKIVANSMVNEERFDFGDIAGSNSLNNIKLVKLEVLSKI